MKQKKKNLPFPPFILILLLITGIVWFSLSPYANTNPSWYEPEVIKSTNGVLSVDLIAQQSEVAIGDKKTKSFTYNASYPSMTWEVNAGETIKVQLRNKLTEPTNFHFHGGHVSPKGNSDNVFVQINPNESFKYQYDLPKNHPAGLFWYHPHFHPDVDDQVLGGMAGAIIVRGALDQLPGITGVPEKLLVLTTEESNDPTVQTRYVNGKLRPTMYLRPGETVRMRVVNASADDFFNLTIPGYKLNIISRDGNTLDQVVSVDHELMAPGNRVEFLFTPKWYGTIPVKSLYFNEGFSQDEKDTFMHIRVQGLPMIPKALPTTLLPYDDLRTVPVDKKRTITFSEGGPESDIQFMIDGKTVDMNRVDQIMELGTTEEWRLVNTSTENHPFHIHINPFQVISINGKPVDFHGYRDVVQLPANGEVVIRTQFLDFDGKFVLHCHILFHEDHGMMQVVAVVKAGNSPAKDNGLPQRELKQMAH